MNYVLIFVASFLFMSLQCCAMEVTKMSEVELFKEHVVLFCDITHKILEHDHALQGREFLESEREILHASVQSCEAFLTSDDKENSYENYKKIQEFSEQRIQDFLLWKLLRKLGKISDSVYKQQVKNIISLNHFALLIQKISPKKQTPKMQLKAGL